VAAAALDWLVDAPAGTVLNVNVPDLPLGRLAGVCQAPLATFGAVETAVREPGHEPFTVQLRVSETQPPADSDMARLRAGWVTVTPLVGIRADMDTEVAPFIQRAVSRAA
jgi:5'-nucleotidase